MIKIYTKGPHKGVLHPSCKPALIDYLGSVCGLCGSPNNLQIHHLDHNKHNQDLTNLVAWCRDCHMSYHKKGNKNNEGRVFGPRYNALIRANILADFLSGLFNYAEIAARYGCDRKAVGKYVREILTKSEINSITRNRQSARCVKIWEGKA